MGSSFEIIGLESVAVRLRFAASTFGGDTIGGCKADPGT